MTRRMMLAVIALSGLATPVSGQGEPPPVELWEVVDRPTVFAGSVINVVGELVGDYSTRGGWTWLQINDDAYVEAPFGEGGRPEGANIGIGVRVRTATWEQLDPGPPGRYGQRGPVVSVTGEFRHLDAELAGETYLAADTISVLEPGRPVAADAPGITLWIGAGLVAVAGALFLGARRKRHIE